MYAINSNLIETHIIISWKELHVTISVLLMNVHRSGKVAAVQSPPLPLPHHVC